MEETTIKAKEQHMLINMSKTVHKINHLEGETIITGVAVEEEEEVLKEDVAIITEAEAADIVNRLILDYHVLNDLAFLGINRFNAVSLKLISFCNPYLY